MRTRSRKERDFLVKGAIAQYNGGHITYEVLMKIIQDLDTELHNGMRNIRYISFNRIPNFIKSVMVHPKASDSLSEEIENICSDNDIHFLGKSTLLK